MSHSMGDIVAIKRTNGSISTAKIIEMPVHYVQDGNTGVVIAKTDDKPVGTRVKGTKNIGYTAAPVYKVQILNDDLKTPTDQVKIVTKHTIVASMEPHLRGWKLLKMKSELPPELQYMVNLRDLEDVDVPTLKLYMNKYKTNPELLKNFKKKMNSIIRRNYGRGALHDFHGGAHPEWIMNAFIYNPIENKYFKFLRIDGNQVTVRLWNAITRNFDDPMHMRLDDFLRIEIPDRTVHQMRTTAMIGEIYGILPEWNEHDLDERDIYLAHLMEVFKKKPSGEPSSEFFSVPIEAVSASSLRRVSNSHAGGSRKRKNTKSTNKRRICSKSKKH
jgi:hypothetical protein